MKERGERWEIEEGKRRDGLRKESECQSLEKLSSLPPLIRVKNTLPSLYRSLTPTSEKIKKMKHRRGKKVSEEETDKKMIPEVLNSRP